jgi:arylsulfatase A-like enzyme
MYDPAESQLPDSGFELNTGLPKEFIQMIEKAVAGVSRQRVMPNRIEPDQLRTFSATLRGLIRHIDHAVGRILEQLDLSKTVVLFTSDHGDYSGHRGLLRKAPWIPFDDLARVPLVLSAPDARGGRRVPSLVQTSDFPLTCLDYAGVDPPAGIEFDSRSLRPLAVGSAAADDDDRAVYCTQIIWPMVRRGAFKHIVDENSGTGVLFDLERDPLESVDLSRDPQHAGALAELSALLRKTLERGVATSPSPV